MEARQYIRKSIWRCVLEYCKDEYPNGRIFLPYPASGCYEILELNTTIFLLQRQYCMQDRGSEQLDKSSWLWISSCLGTKPCLVIVSMDFTFTGLRSGHSFRSTGIHTATMCQFAFCLLSVPVNNWVPLLTGPGRLSSPYQISVRLWFKYEFAEVRPGVVRAISCRHVMIQKPYFSSSSSPNVLNLTSSNVGNR